MKGREKILLDRMMFCIFGVVLIIFLAVFYRILATDSDYRAELDPVAADAGGMLCDAVTPVGMPEDSYLLSTLTFGGTCTPASMLGSSSYGTFNLMYSENGAESFFGGISGLLESDNGTVAGCSAVFSDNSELEPAEKSVTEWYRAPASAADVFSAGGIDAVSLECVRTADYGEAGLSDTKNALSAQSVQWGDSGNNIVFSLADGVDAVVCCFTYTEGCEESVIAQIQTAAQEYDLVALYITDTDVSYTVSDAKRTAYRSFADAGADVVIGTNGTKLQSIEEWNGKTIAYSLGALLDGGAKYPEKYTALLSVNIKVNNGEVAEVSCEPIPLVTYDDSHSWRPAFIGEGEEKEGVLSFMAGERDEPGL